MTNGRPVVSARRGAAIAGGHLAQSEFSTRGECRAETTGMTSAIAPSTSGTQIKSKSFELKTEDFIKMMITQLQNQDPLEPAKNQELLAQMSQIGQLQSSTTLQESLRSMVMQNQIASAANLIGKLVQGMDDYNETVAGVVTSIRMEKDQVHLELDNGKTLQMTRVTHVAGMLQ
jgi:flagellar basal-body rod modification protein FlgD